jgi:hypothetical protein
MTELDRRQNDVAFSEASGGATAPRGGWASGSAWRGRGAGGVRVSLQLPDPWHPLPQVPRLLPRKAHGYDAGNSARASAGALWIRSPTTITTNIKAGQTLPKILRMAGYMRRGSGLSKALSAAGERFLRRGGRSVRGTIFPSHPEQEKKAKRNREIQVAKGSATQAPDFRSRISNEGSARSSRPCPSKKNDGLESLELGGAGGVGLGAARYCTRAAMVSPNRRLEKVHRLTFSLLCF